jgi:hypothetical protein
MISAYNLIKDFIEKSECNELIRYQKPSYNFSGSINVSPISEDIGKESTKTIHDIDLATTLAKSFDYYQLFLCKEIENNSHDPEYVNLLRRYRIVMCGYLKKFEITVEQIKLDFKNKHLVHELILILERMRDFLYRLEESIIPE